MRIAEMVSGTAVNGAAVNCLEVAKALRERGHELTMVVRPEGWAHHQAKQAGIDTVVSSLKRHPGELRRIAHELRLRQIDVLHTHMSSANFFGVILRRLFGIRNVVATAHNRYLQLHWIFNDRVIAVSEATREFHNRVNWVPKRRIDVVHNFIDDRRFHVHDHNSTLGLRNELGFQADDQLVGVIGDVIPRKGLIYLVQALPEIIANCPAVKLVCVGHPKEEYQQKVIAEAEALGVADKIAWLGPRRDIDRLLATLDLYVLPSLEENLPLSILEAMASAVPVLATEVGGIPECVEHGSTGWLVEPGEPGPLAKGVINLLSDSQLATRIGQSGRDAVRSDFSVDSQVKRIEAVFERMVATHADQRRCA